MNSPQNKLYKIVYKTCKFEGLNWIYKFYFCIGCDILKGCLREFIKNKVIHKNCLNCEEEANCKDSELKRIKKFDKDIILNRLIEQETFEDFFVEVCKLKNELKGEDAFKFRELIENEKIFVYKYGSSAITYLEDCIDLEIVFFEYLRKEKKFTEFDMRNEIIENFNIIFKDYKFIGKEITKDKKRKNRYISERY